jgi:RimJ/RimL family protein N-acetyltransferase
MSKIVTVERVPVLHYRQPTVDDAQLLLDWRTRPDITRYMFSDIEYDLGRQKAWLEECARKPGYTHRLICLDGAPIGYTSITITDHPAGIGTVGVYIADLSARAGVANFNFVNTLNHAFLTLGLHKIVNHVLGGNRRLLRQQELIGYRHVGVLREQHLKSGERHDVHIFEQLRSEWIEYREKFRDKRDLDGIERPRPAN